MPLLKRKPDRDHYSESDTVLHTNLEIIFEDLQRLVRQPVDPDAHLAPVPQHEIDEILGSMLLPEEIAPCSNEVISSPADAVSNEVTRPAIKTRKRVSNKVTAPKRGTDSRAKQIIEEIRKIGFAYDDASESSSVANFPPLFATTSFEHAGDRTTLTFANEALELLACEESGTRPVSWSLNLSPKRHDEALRHREGFVDCISGIITRRLEKLLGKGRVPHYWFIVGVEKGRLHLHGGILIAPEQHAAVEAALTYAGGIWEHRKGEEHQLDMNSDRCDGGWIRYPLRDRKAVRDMIGDHHFFIGKKLRVEAKWLYGRYREIVKAKDISAGLREKNSDDFPTSEY